ncbi:MAG TPA: CAP domain-containing protein, partial [Chloroflexota bacterium]|nr:CAP domain-containing protein [Chloroflexota bacterium]
GPRLVGAVVAAAPEVESILGRDLRDSLTFLTPPQTDEGMRTNFGPLGRLEPDPVAEQRMLELVNAERAREGLGALEFDNQLRDVAREHSVEMFELSYFSHTSPVTGSPFDRLRRAGIGFLVAGENLAYAPNVQIAHEGLMNSPGHRANILRPQFGQVGIGVIRSQFRGSMFTQKFTN